MINLMCGLTAMIIFSFFIGGLAYSIFENTGSIAFPIIVAIVLLLAYITLIEEIRSSSHKK
jgi:energy-converting hydrogenase Eha subunit C